MINERRKIPRYLCSDQFSDSLLVVGSREFSLISVNFNRFGIGLYSNINLSEINEQDQALISFQLKTEQQEISIEQLPCKIVRIRESDVGHQYGISFPKTVNKRKSYTESLILIEENLENKNSPENRYGIF
jgi:hypothetical protein